MSTANAVILTPINIIDAMIAAGTSIPVVDTGEVAWAVGTAYTVGTLVNHTGSIWDAVSPSTGVTPGTDSTKWLRKGPTNRMAPFDDQMDTKARGTGSMTYVLRPGFSTGLGLWGMQGDHLNIAIYDQPGGTLVDGYDADLYAQALGLYELLFMPLRQRTQHYMRNLPLYPDAEVHITITATGGGPVAVGLISIGHWDTLLGTSDLGGVEYGANAAVKSYSYRKVNDDGTAVRQRRGSATNVSCSVVIDAEQANHAMELLHQVQGRPVAFIASDLPRYDYLNGFGDLSGDVTPENYGLARMNLKIEGVVQ
ncbi:Carbohydrate binding domain-containing protein [Polaromonas sp. OV174]|uniref:hypothetical protein n=1 Tax=Polaromonas sp. OV174 TaxID=1855300 RepID=UPI0008E0C7B0|nr:hypothetical protein [Polaromonas sp. OV174]SFB74017.1 Carbohydrate binding domain-containing protein [Polaromonas sp. OV174]